LRTIFLTGATGFVGSHTARLFLDRGWRVKALVRRPDRPGLLPAGAEVVPGDLSEGTRYQSALDGCDAIVHVAGLVKARRLAEYRAANAVGTESLARAATAACPAAMFVLVSSQSAAGPARNGRPVAEDDVPLPVSWYGISKLEGEEAVARQCRGPWCIVRPSIVYGGGDPGLLELFTRIQSGWAPIPAGGRSRLQVIAVQDLARVLVAAAERPDLSGRRGFAAAEAITMRQFVMDIAAMRTPPPRVLPVPSVAVKALGLLESARQWVTGVARPFNLDKAREALQPDWLCDPRPLLRDLGIADLTGWKEGIRAVCRCYVDAGWLRSTAWSI
jgi:nucleoside-diphosphate-sugar epimerase